VGERPLSADRRRGEQGEHPGLFLRPPGAGELLFDRLSEPVAIVVATSARLPMVVADLCRSLRAAVGGAGVSVAAVGLAGLGWLGLAEKAITPLGYYWPPRARVQDICFGSLVPLDGEFNNGLVEVIRFVRLHDHLVKTQLSGRQRRELEYLKHNGHEQDKPVRPVLEVLEVSILIPLLKYLYSSRSWRDRTWPFTTVTKESGSRVARLSLPIRSRHREKGSNSLVMIFATNFGLAAGKRSRTEVRRASFSPDKGVTSSSLFVSAALSRLGSRAVSC
jgi:hypothetical protein